MQLKNGQLITSQFGKHLLNKDYSKKLKLDRLKILKKDKNFLFKKIDIKNLKLLQNLFKKHKFDYVVHLAAQAGVRHSLKKPIDYVQNNLIAFFNLIECCKIFKIKHLIFASTSSVYGERETKEPLGSASSRLRSALELEKYVCCKMLPGTLKPPRRKALSAESAALLQNRLFTCLSR